MQYTPELLQNATNCLQVQLARFEAILARSAVQKLSSMLYVGSIWFCRMLCSRFSGVEALPKK
jgi:hypothetical protein